MSKRLDLTDKKFNRLTCIERMGKNKHGQSLWRCECDCGNITTVLGYQVKNGNTKSCGCWKREVTIKRNTVHGLCQNKDGKVTRLYGMWRRMRQRCEDPNSSDAKWYYDRGITVCKGWLGYKVFHEWAISHGYKKGLTIERINYNYGYNPNNCTWIPAAQQARNRKSNHFITYLGKRKTLAEWSESLNIDSSLLRYRLKMWDVEKAFNIPVRKQKKRKINENQTDNDAQFRVG